MNIQQGGGTSVNNLAPTEEAARTPVAAALLALTALLLTVAISRAEGLKEPVYPPYCWAQPSGSELWYPCDSQALNDANCLNLMEMAMKAVDPYLEMMSLPSDKQERIVKLWERAKQGCWSDLKDRPENKHYH